MDNPFSAEEKERIMNLPTVDYECGNATKSVKFDEELQQVYELDQEGELTGKMANVPKDAVEEDVSNVISTIDDSINKNSATDKDDSKSYSWIDRVIRTIKIKMGDETVQPIEKGKMSDKERRENIAKMTAFSIIAITLAIAGLSHFNYGDNSNTTTASIEQTKDSEDADEIVVIQLTRDMIPGERISSQDIRESTISAESYNEITLGDAQLYQWDRADSLLDKFVTTYIPKGQFLTYENIDSVYNPPVNPWTENMDGFQLVSIPIPENIIGDNRLNYGSVVDLTLVKRTVNEADVTDEKKRKDVGNLEHQQTVEQSYVLDKYKIKATIVDLLDPNGESLYDTYTSWCAIPVGEQATYIKNKFKKEPTLEKTITPSFISIKVNPEQSKKLTDILGADTEVTYSFTNELNNNSEAKKNSIKQFEALFDTIKTSQSLAKQEHDNESQQKQQEQEDGK